MRTLTKAADYDLSLEGVARACSDWGAVDGDDGCLRAILCRENQKKNVKLIRNIWWIKSYFAASSMSAQLSKKDRATASLY